MSDDDHFTSTPADPFAGSSIADPFKDIHFDPFANDLNQNDQNNSTDNPWGDDPFGQSSDAQSTVPPVVQAKKGQKKKRRRKKKQKIPEQKSSSSIPLLSVADMKDGMTKVQIRRKANAEKIAENANLTKLFSSSRTAVSMDLYDGSPGFIPRVSELLVKNKLQIDTPDWCHQTMLYVAVDREHVDIVKFLLNNKADPNKFVGTEESPQQMTPFYRACQLGNSDIVRALVEHKADVDTCLIRHVRQEDDDDDGYADDSDVGVTQAARKLEIGPSALYAVFARGHVSVAHFLLSEAGAKTSSLVDELNDHSNKELIQMVQRQALSSGSSDQLANLLVSLDRVHLVDWRGSERVKSVISAAIRAKLILEEFISSSLLLPFPASVYFLVLHYLLADFDGVGKTVLFFLLRQQFGQSFSLDKLKSLISSSLSSSSSSSLLSSSSSSPVAAEVSVNVIHQTLFEGTVSNSNDDYGDDNGDSKYRDPFAGDDDDDGYGVGIDIDNDGGDTDNTSASEVHSSDSDDDNDNDESVINKNDNETNQRNKRRKRETRRQKDLLTPQSIYDLDIVYIKSKSNCDQIPFATHQKEYLIEILEDLATVGSTRRGRERSDLFHAQRQQVGDIWNFSDDDDDTDQDDDDDDDEYQVDKKSNDNKNQEQMDVWSIFQTFQDEDEQNDDNNNENEKDNIHTNNMIGEFVDL